MHVYMHTKAKASRIQSNTYLCFVHPSFLRTQKYINFVILAVVNLFPVVEGCRGIQATYPCSRDVHKIQPSVSYSLFSAKDVCLHDLFLQAYLRVNFYMYIHNYSHNHHFEFGKIWALQSLVQVNGRSIKTSHTHAHNQSRTYGRATGQTDKPKNYILSWH